MFVNYIFTIIVFLCFVMTVNCHFWTHMFHSHPAHTPSSRVLITNGGHSGYHDYGTRTSYSI